MKELLDAFVLKGLTKNKKPWFGGSQYRYAFCVARKMPRFGSTL